MRIGQVHSSNPRVFGVPLLAVLVAVVACGGEGASGSEGHIVRDSAGITIVESVTPGWAEARRIDPEPLLRIGRDEEGPYQLGFVATGRLLAGDRIAVPELRTQEVRVFDGSGRHRITLGGRGEGPGELTGTSGVFAWRGDSLAATDGLLRRTTVYSLEDGGARVIPHRIEEHHDVFGRLDDGTLLTWNPGSGYRPDLDEGLQWTMSKVHAIDPADGAARVLAELPSREQWIESDGNTRLRIPLQGSIHAATSEGFYWATSDRYEIGWYDLRGGLRRILRRPMEPARVQPVEIERYIEANLERVRRFEGESAVPRYRQRYEEEASYGESVPLFGTAFVDHDGRLWVSAPLWPGLGGAPGRWSVFSPEGAWLGDVEAPERLRIVDVRGDILLGIWTDALDVPYVQLHRMTVGDAPTQDDGAGGEP